MRESTNGGAAAGKSYAKKKPGQYSKGGGKGLQGDALVGRVSQSTINDIKRMGMTKALALAGRNGATAGGVAREFQEGVRRMYGADRLKAAKAKYAPAKTTSADAARKSSTNKASNATMKSVDTKKAATTRAANTSVRGGTAKQAVDAMFPKPTAQQVAQAKARAGGNPNLSISRSTPKVETPAQKAAKAALKQKQRAAAAAAVKRAGGRTM